MAIVKMINSPRSQNVQGLRGTIAYCCRDAKTNHEGIKLVTGINCMPQLALQEFMNTKRLHKQTDGRMFYHLVQSFHPDESITPELAHQVACKLAEEIPGFEIVVATHRDAHHIHSHFVINSVRFETGKKYHSDPQTLQNLRDASDALCLQYGLSVVKKREEKERNMNDREYRAYERGNSWKMELEIAIDDCMTLARSKEHFMQLMEWRGYGVTWTDARKSITYTTPQGYKCRDRKLNGRKYLKEEMEYEFKLRAEICRRYAGETKAESGAGIGGATHRGRYGTQLEGADHIAEHSGGNRNADFGAIGSADYESRVGFPDGRPDRCAAGISGCRNEGAGGLFENDYSIGRECTENDAECDEHDGSALWRSERELFESNLRRAEELAQMDDPLSAHQPDPQRGADYSAVDAAYLIAHLSDIMDEEEHDDYYTRRARRGPTLSM